MPTVNLQLLKIAAIIAISAIGFGYDQTWYTGALGQVFFNLNYGSKAVKTPIGSYHVLSAVQTSTAVAVSYVFQVIGLVLGSHVIKVKGRRMGLLSTSAFVIVGVVIEMTGTIGRGEYWVIIAGKWFASIGLGQMLGVGPLYLAECAPSGHRGAMVNTTAFMVTFGSFLAGVANYGVSTMPGTQTGLRILLGVQFIPPILALATIPLLPESPRWLIEVGRLEEAKTVLTFLRSTATREEVDAEVQRIDEIIHLDRLANKSSWADLFRGSNLMRTLTVLGVMCISQANGLAFLSNYALLYLQAVGIKNLFVILMILYGVVCASTCAGFWTQDYFGRRPLMMVTGIVGAVALISLGALTTAYPAPTGAPADAAIALIFIWFVVYATGWSNVPYTLTSELPADHLRPKTWAVAGSGAQLTGMIIGLVNPYIQDEGYGDLKGKVAFIYGAVGIAGVVFVYLLVPELKGKSLNEVNWLYANNVRPRKMGKHTVPVLEEQDTVGSEGKGSVRHMENGA